MYRKGHDGTSGSNEASANKQKLNLLNSYSLGALNFKLYIHSEKKTSAYIVSSLQDILRECSGKKIYKTARLFNQKWKVKWKYFVLLKTYSLMKC